MFYNLANWCQCYKKNSSVLTMRPNKLEYLYLAITFQSSLTFAGSTRSLPKKDASERPSNWLFLALPSNSKTWLERVSKCKPSSLLGPRRQWRRKNVLQPWQLVGPVLQRGVDACAQQPPPKPPKCGSDDAQTMRPGRSVVSLSSGANVIKRITTVIYDFLL